MPPTPLSRQCLVLALPDETITLQQGIPVVFCHQGYNGFAFALPEIIENGGRAGFWTPTGQFCDLDHVVPVTPQAVHPHWYEALEQVLGAYVVALDVENDGNLSLVGYEDASYAHLENDTRPKLDWQAACAKLIYGPILPESLPLLDKVNGNLVYPFTRVQITDMAPNSEGVYEETQPFTAIQLNCPHCTTF